MRVQIEGNVRMRAPLVTFVLALSVIVAIPTVNAADRYWVGTSGGSLFSATNWSAVPGSACRTNTGATVPTKDDVVYFTADCVNNADDGSNGQFDVKGVRIEEGYTGTITYNSSNASVHVGSGGWVQSDGVFDGVGQFSNHLVINGDFLLEGGEFTPLRRLVITGEFTVSGGTFHYYAVEGKDAFEAVNLVSAANRTLGTLPLLNNLQLTDGLVGYWNFEEGTGTSTADRSGGGYSGTLQNNAGWSTDVPPTLFANEGSLQLNADDGSKVYVPVESEEPHMHNIQVGDMTVTAWAKKTDAGNSGYVVSRDQCGNANLYHLKSLNTGAYEFRLKGSTNVIITSDPHPVGEWVHLAGVKTADAMTLYVNGVPEATAASPQRFGSGDGGNFLYIGDRQSCSVPFEGLIDEVRLYNRALSPDEVAALANGYAYPSGSSSTTSFTLSDDLTLDGNLQLGYGVFDLAGNDLTLSGSFVNRGELRLQGNETLSDFENDTSAGTVTYTGNGTYASLAAGDAYFNLTFSGAGTWHLDDALSASGALRIADGVLHLNGNDLALAASSDFSNEGTLRLLGSETLTNLTNDTSNGTVAYVGTGTYVSLAAGDVYHHLSFSGGTFTAPSVLTVYGDFANNATFHHSGGTVLLAGQHQALDGSTTFHHLTKSGNDAATLTFPAGVTQTILGTLTLAGTASAPLTLQSNAVGTAWFIDAQGSRSLSHLSVQDSTNLNASAMACLSGCVDGGRNTGWLFPSADAASTGRGAANGGARRNVEDLIRQAYTKHFSSSPTTSYTSVPSLPSATSRFSDTPPSAWFTPSIEALTTRGIISGYTDAQGNLTGTFGPNDPVTVGQILKIALLAADHDLPSPPSAPRNTTAINDWSAPYVALGESLNLTLSSENVLRSATRGEVISTLLQSFDLPLSSSSTHPFTDLPADHPQAEAIATAHTLNLVTGDTDEEGTLLHTVRPDDLINRAEVAVLVVRFLER